MRNRYQDQYNFEFWPAFSDVIVNILAIIIFFMATYFLISKENMDVLMMRADQGEFEKLFMKQLYVAHSENKYGLKESFHDFKALKSAISFNADGSVQQISFSDNLLFPIGGINISEEGQRLLTFCAHVFKQATDPQGDYLYNRIQVEGYTDRVPIENSLHKQLGIVSNWELSSMRSTSVVKFLQENGVEPSLLSSVGYGEHQALSTKTDSDELRRKDRKINIALFYSLLKQK